MPAAYRRMCRAILRADVGVHRAGEPIAMSDESGRFVRCPQCGAENREDPVTAVRGVGFRLERAFNKRGTSEAH
jgi:hypothetical protein